MHGPELSSFAFSCASVEQVAKGGQGPEDPFPANGFEANWDTIPDNNFFRVNHWPCPFSRRLHWQQGCPGAVSHLARKDGGTSLKRILGKVSLTSFMLG